MAGPKDPAQHAVVPLGHCLTPRVVNCMTRSARELGEFHDRPHPLRGDCEGARNSRTRTSPDLPSGVSERSATDTEEIVDVGLATTENSVPPNFACGTVFAASCRLPILRAVRPPGVRTL